MIKNNLVKDIKTIQSHNTVKGKLENVILNLIFKK
jgi:hypothetical protein